MMRGKLKLLFICSLNKKRSKTAEVIYREDKRFEVRSAGVDEQSETPVNSELLDWADHVVVMEEFHRKWLAYHYPGAATARKVMCLSVPDHYEFMDPELITLLKSRIEEFFNAGG